MPIISFMVYLSSNRYAGFPDSYKRDSLNIYDGDSYTGYEWQISEDSEEWEEGLRTK